MKRHLTSILLISFLITSCGNKKTEKSNQQNPDNKTNCKLSRVVDGPIALGFPKVEGLAPSLGKLNITVLFVDFEDVPATQSTDSIF
ncbi:MAG: hypothetical protein WBM56_05970, partial [Robiginitalea sp.]